MAVSLLVALTAVAGSAILGVLSRQPEINRLKKQIKLLQREIMRLCNIVEEQNRQIEALKMQVTGLKGYQRVQALGRTKGAVMQQYAFKEYIDLSCKLVREGSITEEEEKFFNIYENMLHGIEEGIGINEKVYLKEYLYNKYSDQIEKTIVLDTTEIANRLEEVYIA